MNDIARRAETRVRRLRRMLAFGLTLLFVGTLAFPLGGYLYLSTDGAAVAAQTEQPTDQQSNPRANYWGAVREGRSGTSTVKGEWAKVMIQSEGDVWRQLRNGPVARIGAWVLAGVLALIAIFHFTIGPHRIEQAESGDRVPRWSVGERALHWFTAVLFIVLAITGLSLLFGRAVLIPVLGPEVFSAYAGFAKTLHNYLGPFFLAGVLVEVVVWMRFNLFSRDDLHWLKHLGGMLSGEHVHAGRTNGGEKVWFWFIATIGLLVVGLTGLWLDFPIFGQDRQSMQIANVLHASFGMLWIVIAFGHIYLGTLGTPGSLDGMTKGHVSKEWAQAHHDRWYEEMQRKGKVGAVEERPETGGSFKGQQQPSS